MTNRTLLLQLCGLGVVAGTVGLTAATAGPVTVTEAAPPASGSVSGPELAAGESPAITSSVEIASGPALDGRRTELTLTLRPGGVRRAGVTDLLPSAVGYVPGSSRLGTGRTTGKVADPRLVATPSGTLLVWAELEPTGRAHRTLTFAVRPVGHHPASWSWTDRASITSPLVAPTGEGPTAPGRTPPAGTADHRVEEAPIWAVERARRAASRSDRRVVRANTGTLVEQVTVETGAARPLHAPTLTVYLPGTVRWMGCATGVGCRPPTVRHRSMRTEPGHVDLPLLARPGAKGDQPSANGPLATFTVLTWHLAGSHTATSTTWAYRIDALATRTPRTQDLVAASVGVAVGAAETRATVTVPTIQAWPTPVSTGGAHPARPVRAHAPLRVLSKVSTGSPTTGRSTAGGSRTGRLPVGPSTTAHRGRARRIATTRTRTTRSGLHPAGPAESRATTARGTPAASPANLAAAPDRNPFWDGGPSKSVGPGRSTRTTRTPAAKPAATPKASGVDAPLAYTGADIEQGGATGVTLLGLGGVLVLGSRKRRSRRSVSFWRGRSRRPDPGTTGCPTGVASPS